MHKEWIEDTSSNRQIDIWQQLGLAQVVSGLLLMLVYAIQLVKGNASVYLYASMGLVSAGTILYAWGQYRGKVPGIKNNKVWNQSLSSRGLLAWTLGAFLTGFYVLLYWFPELLGLAKEGESNFGLIALFDPLSYSLKGQPASEWFVYGALYTLAIILMGIKFLFKYRHSPYHMLRTGSLIFFQLGFAFLLPELLMALQMPYNDFKNMWPLNYYFFDEWNVQSMLQSGRLGLFMIIWGVLLVVLVSPILTYFFGKRWYCSWVCGCGALAETAGDPFRHLSDKSMRAWKWERWIIHLVLVWAVVMTVWMVYAYLAAANTTFWLNHQAFAGFVIAVSILIGAGLFIRRDQLFQPNQRVVLWMAFAALALIALPLIWALIFGTLPIDPWPLRSWYGFYIGAAFSGVIGVGFYPILGSRVWCRFGCPMAAILGLQQKWFSRFRITTNGGQCISCGNCSTYCEMGIDVKSYAQRGEHIVRASCVGCGICSAVCPRGVLKLENGSHVDKTHDSDPIEIKDGVVRLRL